MIKFISEHRGQQKGQQGLLESVETDVQMEMKCFCYLQNREQ